MTAPEPAPVVLLPGMLCTRRLWAGVVPLLPKPTTAIHPVLDGATIEAMVDSVLEQVPGPFDLVGHSLGGIVAMALVQRAPERVRRLALLSTNARPPRAEQRQAWDELESAVAAGRFLAAAESTLLPSPQHGTGSALSVAVREMVIDTGPERFVRQLRAQASRTDLRPGLGDLRRPTRVLAPADDAVVPVATHHDIADRSAGATLRVLPRCGHLAPLEQPAAVAAAIGSLLGGEDQEDHVSHVSHEEESARA